MPEATDTQEAGSLRTRTEHARSLEDAKKYQAIQVLTDVGLLTPITQIETFHGRVEKTGEEWKVDPGFANHGDATGNHNVNQRSTLYTSAENVAKDFAIARGLTQGTEKFEARVHEIISSDSDATIIDSGFNYRSLDEQNQDKYKKALEVLAIPTTEGSPVDFDARDSIGLFAEAMNKLQKNFALIGEIPDIAATAGIDYQVALQLASAYNARQIALVNPSHLVGMLFRYSSDIVKDNIIVNGQQETVPVNLEYAQRYFRNAHIVGARQYVISATLGKLITITSLFDLTKVGTREQIATQKNTMQQKLGGLVNKIPQLPKLETEGNERMLLEVLDDAHAKPETLIETAKKIGDYAELFDGDVGLWEGFTLAEHTETVLRNFDENFADIIPVEFLAPMRLAILVHDLGKPLAAANGERGKQKDYNATQAEDFLTRLNVNKNLKGLLLNIIGDGSDLAFQLQSRPGENSQTTMRTFAQNSLGQFFGTEEITEPQIEAFAQMCKMFQLCDGGAYTSMAITRRDGQGRFRNAPSFNNSFSSPIELGKRDIRYRNQNELAAPRKLTPEG